MENRTPRSSAWKAAARPLRLYTCLNILRSHNHHSISVCDKHVILISGIFTWTSSRELSFAYATWSGHPDKAVFVTCGVLIGWKTFTSTQCFRLGLYSLRFRNTSMQLVKALRSLLHHARTRFLNLSELRVLIIVSITTHLVPNGALILGFSFTTVVIVMCIPPKISPGYFFRGLAIRLFRVKT